MGSKFGAGEGGSEKFQQAFADMSTKPKRGGLFNTGAEPEDFINMLTQAAALAQGDYGSAAEIGNGMAKRRATLADREAARVQQQMLYEALAAKGYGPDDIQIAMTNPEAMGTNFNKRFEPEKPPEAARTAEWYQNADPDQRAAYDATHPIVTNGYGSTVVPRSSLGGAPPPDAIADLRANPSLAPEFDKAYGPGASARVMGGGVGNDPGGFRFR